MTALEDYLRAAERCSGISREEILARVLHVDTAALSHLRTIKPGLSDEVAALAAELDFAIRVRSPGVHYVYRSTYLGYRREAQVAERIGARTQVFLSMLPKTRYLKLVFSLPDGTPRPPFTEPLDERGHHGVGTMQCRLRSAADLQQFVETLDPLLRSA